jgi:hypothetical protein
MQPGRARFPGLLGSAAAIILLVATVSAVARAQEGLSDEYEIRAAMIVNLTHFIQWPGWKMTAEHHAFEVCELGSDPVTASLEKQFSGKAVFDKPVWVRHLGKDETPDSCHLLYVSESERKRFVAIAPSLNKQAVLSVGAQDWLLASGGAISMPMIDDRVRIQIQITSVQQGGWVVSSKLLSLATIRR